MRHVLFALAVIASALNVRPAAAEQIWFEQGIASVTAGIDPSGPKTFIRKYYLAVIGPESFTEATAAIVRHCSAVSAVAAQQAFAETASPEIGVRLGAAYTAFNATVSECFLARSVAKEVIEQFHLSIVDRVQVEDGVHFLFDAESPSARRYRELGTFVEKHVGGGLGTHLNKALNIYADAQGVKIDIKLPSAANRILEANKWVAVLPSKAEGLFRGAALKAFADHNNMSPWVGVALGVPEEAAIDVVNQISKTTNAVAKQELEKVLDPRKDPAGTIIMTVAPGPAGAVIMDISKKVPIVGKFFK